jgi:uncharacterized membrane protein
MFKTIARFFRHLISNP